ncbi:MAG TPA: hypothetical protein VMR70_18830 [Flavisolibacter sp.]|nr:hypothetical protein [Flavisolibacter sp.]
MKKDYFLLKDRIAQIEASFLKEGWLTIYEQDGADHSDQRLIFCCLVSPNLMASYKQNRDWVIEPGSEGKPTVMSTFVRGRWKSKYQTYADKGIEPFLFSRRFSHNREHYIDLSEEFVLYFHLYENGENKQKRTYYYVDDLGELEEVIRIVPGRVTVKFKYLMEYLSVRKMHFAILFDFMRLAPADQEGFMPLDQDFQTEKHYYNHYIRHMGFALDENPLQSWIHGKAFIHYDPAKSEQHHFDRKDLYESYITGYDEKGDEILETCTNEPGKLLKLVYFKKEVLDKYYNDPGKYEVDGWHVKSPFFYLKIDNHHDDYVAVFLRELGMIPHKEQLHWKRYNLPPQRGMSHAYYKTMIEGAWAEQSGTPDLFFKERYREFNEKWKAKFGWLFYKPLSKEDAHQFTALHIPTSNNVKSFCEQVLSLVKITVDSLNEKMLAQGTTLEEGDKGITKLEKFLEQRGYPLPDMILFLRNLYSLRSGLLAHRFSESNAQVKKAMVYFGMGKDNYITVATDIFIKSVYTLNTLTKFFLKE